MVEGKSEREVARYFGVHRKTVKKMCQYAAPPGYRRKKEPISPKLAGFTGIIDAILEADKQRLRYGYWSGYGKNTALLAANWFASIISVLIYRIRMVVLSEPIQLKILNPSWMGMLLLLHFWVGCHNRSYATTSRLQ